MISPVSSPLEDDTIDYFGDLEGANVDELELNSPKKELSRRMMIRQASDMSEASVQISSTPEAESYFKRKTALLQERALRGELDINVPADDDDISGASPGALQVLPSSQEIEIFNLSEEPVLQVRDALTSSFENLYEKSAVSERLEYGQRDSFHATYNVPERVSSFENLYDPARTSLTAASGLTSQHRYLPGLVLECADAKYLTLGL